MLRLMEHKIPNSISLRAFHGISSLLFLLLLSSLFLFNIIYTPLQPALYILQIALRSSFIISPSSSTLPSSSSGLSDCDYSEGTWVWDENYGNELYTEEDCAFLDPGFKCTMNGREKEAGYRNWRWQPRGCDLPRFNPREMLERSRNKRIAIVGDSLGRNQWESLVCMLAGAVKNKSSIYEADGKPISKHKGFFRIRFHDYNLTVEYYRAPFLVATDKPPSEDVRSVIRIDKAMWMAKHYAGVDVLIFVTGHWWTSEKTTDQGRYFQVGDAVDKSIGIEEAYKKAMETVRLWALSNLKLDKSFLFFTGYSPTHWINGDWNTGGICNQWTQPMEKYTSEFAPSPWINEGMAQAVREVILKKKNAHFLNVTYLTELRYDGHPSKFREAEATNSDGIQDCSHWCLPGVPDTWNHILYANLFSMGYHNEAVNISSRRPVSVDRHWYTGEILVRFVVVLKGCAVSVVVTCGNETGHVREVGMTVEDVDGISVSGKESLEILKAVMDGGRVRVKKEEEVRVRERYEEYVKRKRERREMKERREGMLDLCCTAFGAMVSLVFMILLAFR